MKQTAVEWLETQIVKFHNWKLNPIYDENCFDEIELDKSIKQAKEIENKQKGYSEEEVLELWNWLNDGFIIRKSLPTREELIGWFETFKNK